MGDGADAVQLVAGRLHFFTVPEGQAKVIFIKLDLADEAFELPRYKIIPYTQVLQVVLDRYLI
jgi:hypothetical protein